MPAHQPLRGVLAPNLTPFRDTGPIDTGLYAAHALRLLNEENCVGLVPFGTTGEALSVGVEERVAALESLVAAGVPPGCLLPGTGLCNFAETLHLTRNAAGLGCRGALVLPPFFYKNVAEEGLFAHYARLAESIEETGFGIYLYHIPQVSGVGIPVSLARRLHEAYPERIIGIKDSSGDWENTSALLEIPGFAVYPGQESRLLEALERGAPGTISATANVSARPIAELIRLYDTGDIEAAGGQIETVRSLRKAIEESPPIPTMKRLLALATGDANWAQVRPPWLPVSEAAGQALAARLQWQL